MPELASLRVAVMEEGSKFLGHRIIPINALNSGKGRRPSSLSPAGLRPRPAAGARPEGGQLQGGGPELYLRPPRHQPSGVPQEQHLCRRRQRRGSGHLTECLSFSETTGAISQVADIYWALKML